MGSEVDEPTIGESDESGKESHGLKKLSPELLKSEITKKDLWSPPGGKELFIHSHFSDRAGVSDSDGLGAVMEKQTVSFVEDILEYQRKHKLTTAAAEEDSRFLELFGNKLLKIVGTREGNPDLEDADWVNPETTEDAAPRPARRRKRFH